MEQNTVLLKEKLKSEIDSLDSDKIRELYNFVSDIASTEAIKIANKEWDNKNISRNKIIETIEAFRKNKEKFSLKTDKWLNEKMDYMHANPIRKGFVIHPEHWKYSSARNWHLDDDSIIRINH